MGGYNPPVVDKGAAPPTKKKLPPVVKRPGAIPAPKDKIAAPPIKPPNPMDHPGNRRAAALRAAGPGAPAVGGGAPPPAAMPPRAPSPQGQAAGNLLRRGY